MVHRSDKLYQINIGRRGITDGIIVEIARQLEERGSVKVKLLKVFTDPLEREEIDACFATIEQLVSHIAVGTLIAPKRRGYTKTYTLEKRS